MEFLKVEGLAPSCLLLPMPMVTAKVINLSLAVKVAEIAKHGFLLFKIAS